MNLALGIAVYGALVSSILAGITVYRFFESKKFIRISRDYYYGDEDNEFCFLIANTSGQKLMITECWVNSFARNRFGRTAQVWGSEPDLSDVTKMSASEPGKVLIPFSLDPGAIIYAEVEGKSLLRNFRADQIERKKSGAKIPNYCNRMNISVHHSLSNRPTLFKFRLSGRPWTRTIKIGPVNNSHTS